MAGSGAPEPAGREAPPTGGRPGGWAVAIGWAGVAAAVLAFALGSHQGWLGAGDGLLAMLLGGALTALVSGSVALRRKRRRQGRILLVLGLVLSGLPLALVVVLAAAYSAMAH